MRPITPANLDLKKDKGLRIEWADGSVSFYPIAYLRRMSPSADVRELRKEMARNPLAVLPSRSGADGLTATDAELVGNYAIRIHFSDGHSTGIYTWEYLREIDPERLDPDAPAPGDEAPPHANPLGLGHRRPAPPPDA